MVHSSILQQFYTMLKLVLFLLFIGWSSAGLFSSTKDNAEIAKQNYPDSPVEQWTARNFGDELPNLRNDLIERKNQGEGFIQRHYNAWKNENNWVVDPNNDAKEAADPDLGP